MYFILTGDSSGVGGRFQRRRPGGSTFLTSNCQIQRRCLHKGIKVLYYFCKAIAPYIFQQDSQPSHRVRKCNNGLSEIFMTLSSPTCFFQASQVYTIRRSLIYVIYIRGTPINFHITLLDSKDSRWYLTANFPNIYLIIALQLVSTTFRSYCYR